MYSAQEHDQNQKHKMVGKYKLYYFPTRGRAEMIRYIFAYANVPYENITVTSDEWFGEKKKEMPFGVIPVLELENGVKLSQSIAIARYLASKFGLTSKDDLENAWGDQLVLCVEDLNAFITPYAVALLTNQDQTKVKESWEKATNEGIIPLFDRFQKMLGDKTWFCGHNIHWADLCVAEIVNRIETTFNKKDLLTKYPNLMAHSKRVHDIPNIRKYTETRPKYPC